MRFLGTYCKRRDGLYLSGVLSEAMGMDWAELNLESRMPKVEMYAKRPNSPYFTPKVLCFARLHKFCPFYLPNHSTNYDFAAKKRQHEYFVRGLDKLFPGISWTRTGST